MRNSSREASPKIPCRSCEKRSVRLEAFWERVGKRKKETEIKREIERYRDGEIEM